MTAIYGQKSSFSATDANIRINIEDLVAKYEDYKFPALKRLDGSIFKKAVLSHKYEWSERDLRPIKAEVVSEVGQSAVSVTVDTAGAFNVDDVITVKRTSEKLLVTAVSGGVNLTIERGYGDTSALGSALIEGEELVRTGVAGAEGSEFGHGVTTGADDLFNFTQTYRDVLEMSDGQHKGFIHGDESQTDGIQRIQQELMEGLHLNLFMGVRYRNAASKRSMHGGFKYFVDTYAPGNAIDFGGAGTWTNDVDVINKIEDSVEAIATKMGGKPTIYATYKALRKVRLVQDDTIYGSREDKERGVGVVDKMLTGMGKLDIVQVIDRSGVMDDFIFLVDEKKAGYKARKGRGWFTEHLAKTSDGHKWSVVGEYTVKVENPKASVSYIHNLGL